MWGATGAHQHVLVFVLGVKQGAQNVLILLRRDVREFFATTRTDHEKDIQNACTEFMCPVDDLGQLLIIHGLRAEVYLELEAISLTRFDARDGTFPCPGNATEGVVFLRVKGINANTHSHDADFNEFFGQTIIDQHAIGAKHHHES